MTHDATETTRAMPDIMALRDRYQEKLRAHPFYDWVRDENRSLDHKLLFMPAMTLFVMNFRDMNLWVIRFAKDEDDVLKQVINSSTTEDETHSKLFLEDWRKLHFDDRLDWKPSDVLWWLFLAPQMEDFRRFGVEFMRLSVEDDDDPLVRFAHSEAGEACGHVFFEHISPLADELGKARGLNYRYFGLFHLELETGHVLNSEDVFQDQPLTEDQFQHGTTLAKRMFGIFDGIHDSFLAYANAFVDKDAVPVRSHTVRYVDERDRKTSEDAAPAKSFQQIHATQTDLQEHLELRMKQSAAHPFYDWLRDSELPAQERLQRFLPLWAFDMLGYRDLNKYVFKYAEPTDDLERSVNAIASNLETHSQLFLQDWVELGLDEALRWPASDTLEFLFLDHYMDHHRHTLIHFGMLGLRHRDALRRLWLMEALETSGYAFFEATKQVAELAERDQGLRLDYLADRHQTVHPTKYGDVVNFKALEITDATVLRDVHMFIETVFDALDENLTTSLEAAKRNKLAIRPIVLPGRDARTVVRRRAR